MASQVPFSPHPNLIFQKEAALPVTVADKGKKRSSTDALKTGPLTVQRPTAAGFEETADLRHTTMLGEDLITPQNDGQKLRKEAEVP